MRVEVLVLIKDKIRCRYFGRHMDHLFKNIDCRYLLEPPFQVRTIYVLRKIPKLVLEKYHFTAIQIAVFSIGVLT